MIGGCGISSRFVHPNFRAAKNRRQVGDINNKGRNRNIWLACTRGYGLLSGLSGVGNLFLVIFVDPA